MHLLLGVKTFSGNMNHVCLVKIQTKKHTIHAYTDGKKDHRTIGIKREKKKLYCILISQRQAGNIQQ